MSPQRTHPEIVSVSQYRIFRTFFTEHSSNMSRAVNIWTRFYPFVWGEIRRRSLPNPKKHMKHRTITRCRMCLGSQMAGIGLPGPLSEGSWSSSPRMACLSSKSAMFLSFGSAVRENLTAVPAALTTTGKKKKRGGHVTPRARHVALVSSCACFPAGVASLIENMQRCLYSILNLKHLLLEEVQNG